MYTYVYVYIYIYIYILERERERESVTWITNQVRYELLLVDDGSSDDNDSDVRYLGSPLARLDRMPAI